jgi:hypothetical protein
MEETQASMTLVEQIHLYEVRPYHNRQLSLQQDQDLFLLYHLQARQGRAASRREVHPLHYLDWSLRRMQLMMIMIRSIILGHHLLQVHDRHLHYLLLHLDNRPYLRRM